MAEIERIYTIPLSGAYNSNRRTRAKRAMKINKEFLARHMKTAPENVWISQELNDYILSHGMQAPPRKVRLKVRMGSDAIARAELADGKKPDAKATPEKKEAKKAEKPAEAKQKPAEAKPKPAEAKQKPAEAKQKPAETKPNKEEKAK